jgi:hypothetical protein
MKSAFRFTAGSGILQLHLRRHPKPMTMRRQERRLEEELQKRELRLRALANQAPGRSGPPTNYFRHEVRRHPLLHPLFALKFPRADGFDLERFVAWHTALRSMPLRNRRAWASAGALAVALASATAAVVIATQGRPGASNNSAATASFKPLWHPPRAVSTPTIAAPHAGPPNRVSNRRPRPARRVQPTRPEGPVQSTPAQHTTFVSNPAPAATQTSVAATTQPTQTTVAAAPSGGGPTPLPAPAVSAPSPMRVP